MSKIPTRVFIERRKETCCHFKHTSTCTSVKLNVYQQESESVAALTRLQVKQTFTGERKFGTFKLAKFFLKK